MRRHEIWLVFGVYTMTGVAFAYVVEHDLRLEYEEVVVNIAAILALAISGLTFLALLKR